MGDPRVRQQSVSAMKIAQFLETHPKVTKVMYPGLASFPQKDIADKYHRDGLHESMLTACAVMTHANMEVEDRLKVGITDGFIRISVGIEDCSDLIASLKEALDSL